MLIIIKILMSLVNSYFHVVVFSSFNPSSHTDQRHQGEDARDRRLRGRNHQVRGQRKGRIQRGVCVCVRACNLELLCLGRQASVSLFVVVGAAKRDGAPRDQHAAARGRETQGQDQQGHGECPPGHRHPKGGLPPPSPTRLFSVLLFFHLKFELCAFVCATVCLWWPCRCRSAGCRTT